MANSEYEIFDIQNKLEKLGKAADDGTENFKAKAIRELDENMAAIESDKGIFAEEIGQIETEMQQTMLGIKSLGLITLELEAELEQSWQIVRKTASEAEKEVSDKFNVTEENVTAYMSSIEMKVAELLMETGNSHQVVQQVAKSETTPQVDFT